MITAKYFKEAEFKRCTPSCSLQDMDQEFMNKLDKMREIAGIPMVMNSAYRSPAWEKAHGRSGEGDHPQRCGGDIKCLSGVTRMKLVKAALSAGFRRIGIGKSYIHVGCGKNLPQDVIWHYYE